MEGLRIFFIICTLICSFVGFAGWLKENDFRTLIVGILFVPVITVFVRLLIIVSTVLIG